MLGAHLGRALLLQAVMGALCGASEYDELPVRHNEDQLNLGLSKEVRMELPTAAPVHHTMPSLCCA
jgi:activating signal cointegrator complex subunit 3